MKLRRVSASQVDAFKRCQRYWYFGWVDKIKTPPSPAMQRGSDIHAEIEFYLKYGRVRSHAYAPYVKAAIPLLPDPKTARELLVEQEIKIDCGKGVTWIGYIDILHCDRNPLLVLDTKTTSDFRYSKTPEQLRNNTQLNSYGKYVYEMGHEGVIQLAHLYIKTNPKQVPAAPKTKFVDVLTNIDQVNTVWDQDMIVVKEMALVAECVKSAHELPPTTSACGMYGGCQHRASCGLGISDFINAGTTGAFKKGKGANMSSFLERLKNKKAAGAGATPPNGTGGQTKASSVPVVAKPEGILPDDAPDRVTKVKSAEEIAAEAAAEEAQVAADKAAKAADKAAAKAAKAAAAPATRKRKSSSTATHTPGLHLYIDCMPVKDVDGTDIDPTLFEDWIGPILFDLNNEVMASEKLPDYRLLPYSQEKAAFHAAVEARMDRLPQAMIVNTGTPGSKEALAVLIPNAVKVMRAIR